MKVRKTIISWISTDQAGGLVEIGVVLLSSIVRYDEMKLFNITESPADIARSKPVLIFLGDLNGLLLKRKCNKK